MVGESIFIVAFSRNVHHVHPTPRQIFFSYLVMSKDRSTSYGANPIAWRFRCLVSELCANLCSAICIIRIIVWFVSTDRLLNQFTMLNCYQMFDRNNNSYRLDIKYWANVLDPLLNRILSFSRRKIKILDVIFNRSLFIKISIILYGLLNAYVIFLVYRYIGRMNKSTEAREIIRLLILSKIASSEIYCA